jgi:hypothetical protein
MQDEALIYLKWLHSRVCLDELTQLRTRLAFRWLNKLVGKSITI